MRRRVTEELRVWDDVRDRFDDALAELRDLTGEITDSPHPPGQSRA